MNDLNECPFCGGTAIRVYDHLITHDLSCSRCGCHGPIAENAYKAWNHRLTEDKLREALDLSENRVKRLENAIRSMRSHQTEMGGSFNQWYQEICEIGLKALAGEEG